MSAAVKQLELVRVDKLTFENSAVRHFVNASENYDADKDEFCQFFQMAENEFNIPRIDLESEFKVASSTIGRWSAGESVPAKYSRKIVVRRLANLVIKHFGSNQPLLHLEP